MPTFFARRYVRRIEAVGRTERLLGGLILLLLAGIVVAFVAHVSADRKFLFDVDAPTDRPAQSASPAHTADAQFPAIDLAGWRAPSHTARYTADKLYVKIDGRADAYLKHDVIGLAFGTYTCEVDPQRMVDVYVYDFRAPPDARAIYDSEKPPDAATAALGCTGYQAGGAVFFCKGSSYVQVLPSLPDEAETDVARTIAMRLAERIHE